MKSLLNPRWLLVFNTLPMLVLFYIFYTEYTVVHTLLDETQNHYWEIFSSFLGMLALINLAFTIYLIVRKKQTVGILPFIMLVVYILWFYLFLMHLDEIFPGNIRRMRSMENLVVYTSALLMPTLIYMLLVLVIVWTKKPAKKKVWVNFLFVIVISAFLCFYFWGGLSQQIRFLGDHGFLITLIVCSLLFLFFLARGMYVLLAKRSAKWKKYGLLWKVPIAIILPIIALILNNNGVGYGAFLFGDFRNVWFFVLACLNGVLICIPRAKGKTFRLVLYLLRCITFAFTLYFFLVFLPVLPLSVAAIALFGIGFLMLTPLVVFLLHTDSLAHDFRYLKRYHTSSRLLVLGIICFLSIPAMITVEFVKDRQTLHQALGYVYEPDYSHTYNDIDEEKLLRILEYIKGTKNNPNILFTTQYYQPYISSWYNWLVLNNLTLSDNKIITMLYLFSGIGPEENYVPDSEQPDEQVRITQSNATTRYDESQDVWISELNLEITNFNDSDNSEYWTNFELPDGCWISDYYLYVGDRKEPGILTEKRSAMWVYSQIKNEKKDPGILHYETGNRIVFKVFPFLAQEVRKTGIELIHKEPFMLVIDDRLHLMGDTIQGKEIDEVISVGDKIDYISTQAKQTMTEADREPYFHFILDNSSVATENKEKYIYYTEKLMAEYPALAENARFSITNTYVQTFTERNEWKQHYWSSEPRGGFFLDRAMKAALVEGFKAHRYPVIVVLSLTIEPGFIEKDLADYSFLLPESDFFYLMDNEGKLSAHSLTHKPYVIRMDSLETFEPPYPVLKYTDENDVTSYVRNNNAPTVLLKEPIFSLSSGDIAEKNWETGLLLQGHWVSQILHPETADKGWLKLADASLKSRIMTPVTSYIVVENEEQRVALKSKQRQVMSADSTLDTGEESRSMSEPGLLVMVLLLGGVSWIMRRKKGQDRSIG